MIRFLTLALLASAALPTVAHAQDEDGRPRGRADRFSNERPAGAVAQPERQMQVDRPQFQRPDRPSPAERPQFQRPERGPGAAEAPRLRPDGGNGGRGNRGDARREWVQRQMPDQPRSLPDQPRPDARNRGVASQVVFGNRDQWRNQRGDRNADRRARDRDNARRDWDRNNDGRRDWNRDDGRGQDWNRNDNRGRDWNDARRWDGNAAGNWRGRANNRAWNRDWRSDNRYDWQRFRSANRAAYRLPRYYAPSGWNYGYRQFGIGSVLFSGLFAQSYWIGDPYAYRLPPVEWPYRWVRYYDDALLVDTTSGEVVDTIPGIFW